MDRGHHAYTLLYADDSLAMERNAKLRKIGSQAPGVMQISQDTGE